MRWGVVAAAACLAGCMQSDPYLVPGMWQPTGANTLNLAAMVVQPKDLARGRGSSGYSAVEAVPPVSRLWSGHPAPLPSDSSQASPSGPAATPGATPGQGGT